MTQPASLSNALGHHDCVIPRWSESWWIREEARQYVRLYWPGRSFRCLTVHLKRVNKTFPFTRSWLELGRPSAPQCWITFVPSQHCQCERNFAKAYRIQAPTLSRYFTHADMREWVASISGKVQSDSYRFIVPIRICTYLPTYRHMHVYVYSLIGLHLLFYYN